VPKILLTAPIRRKSPRGRLTPAGRTYGDGFKIEIGETWLLPCIKEARYFVVGHIAPLEVEFGRASAKTGRAETRPSVTRNIREKQP
jgi:hypothetical protein